MGFWDKALQGGTAPSVVPTPPVVAAQPFAVMQPSQTQQTLALPTSPAAPNKAISARSDASCPDCGSGNIFKPHGQPNAMEQCYHCGWNPRFAHSTAGAGLPSDNSTPTQPSRQVSTANNFNPQTIVAKVQ